MTEIEKRAKELAGACEATKDDFGYGYRKGLEEGYIQGATEQKTIDIYNACAWLESHFRDIENPTFIVGEITLLIWNPCIIGQSKSW